MEGKVSLNLSFILVFCIMGVYCIVLRSSRTYPVESKTLHIPLMEDIVKALRKNLTTTFQNVEVNLVMCPDLREPPFSLALQGAGAGPFLYLKTASEIIANLNITNGQLHSLSQIGTVKDGNIYTQVIPDSVSTYSFMVNLFVSQGKPGRVIEVKVSKRIGEDNFPSTIRETLKKAFPDKAVGLGGTFLVKNSRVNIHVQPQFSEIPLNSFKMRDEWLVFFNVSAPMVGVGMLITDDPGLDLRPYHFHCLSDHNAAGHYHQDVDKETVEYLGYFTVAEKVVRVDRPQTKINK